ncbi:FMN-linked oxidoreductase [Pseudovirgaria hyperparasitica]|uniref:Dihydroorotate dehydrogenase (quinone), mitochondrial n=1 Tax=Pseudovirgaria hyperparasitica TaxID=470096 RepID=A0A6A6VZN0_9PEZI|nr:FMN-linked oxidoreductase [Pseudovirgaria hyperparasitica]KAF2755705.1 FMN-linked oxidoreductase [Pseudovirgaria hyperparasitica]
MPSRIAALRGIQTTASKQARCHTQTLSSASHLSLKQQISSYRTSTLHSSRWRHPHSYQPCSQHRNASTVAYPATRAKNTILGTTLLLLAAGTLIYTTDTRASIHKYLVPRIMRLLFPDAEDAHHAGISTMAALYAAGLHPRERSSSSPDLRTTVFGTQLANPIAISAGLDKDGLAIDPLFALGPSIVEIGGITPRPQEGNPKPRVWRVQSQEGMLNRYGLNSAGAAAVALTLRRRVRTFADKLGWAGPAGEQAVLNGNADVPPGSLLPGRLLAVQIAKNKDTPESDQAAVAADYVSCVQHLGPYADILVVNVSSPNTPGLRSLQAAEPLTHLLSAVVSAAQNVSRKSKPKVMVKVSPDEASEDDISGIVAAVHASGVSGVIVANTTKTRPVHAPSLLTAQETHVLTETGGFSGPALLERTVELVGRYRRALDEGAEGKSKVIFASGGICSGADVLRVLEAGAAVGMAYTALTYQGAGWVTESKRQLQEALNQKS